MAVTQTTTHLAATDGLRLIPARSIRRRARLERTLYGAAALGLTITPHTDLWPAHLGAAGIAAGSLYWLTGRFNRHSWTGFLKTCQKTVPAITGATVYLTNYLTPGTAWWEYALPAAWGLTMAATLPLTSAAGLTPEPDPDTNPATPTPATTVLEQAPPATYGEYRTRQWQTARATGTTLLAGVTQYQDNAPDFWGYVIAEEGDIVPDLNPTTLAGVFDLPVGTVTLHLIDGSGPGRKLLQARPTLDTTAAAQQDPVHRLFTEKLARPGGGADNMRLVGYRADSNRIALRVTAPDDEFIQLNQKKIARSLAYNDPTLVMIETDGMANGVISVYKTHPLLNVREATLDDLTMTADGTIALGQQPDGRTGRIPLYDPQMGAITDLFVGAPGAGKSVTLLHVIAAERISGIVSIAADAQDGMSLPEIDGRVYHFGKGIAATAATLAAANDLGKYREKVSAQNGWGSFDIGNPWPLVNVTLDELNRILSADATVPRPFRKWVTGLVGDTQSTGRKLGLGIRFAAQSIHLADLGDKDRIRANAKNGTVWLGRTNSSTTQHMARDGVLPPGVELSPIPRYFGTEGSSIDAAFHGKEAAHGPITAGMANIINGGSLYVNRTWYARKENKTYPHLIGLMEANPIPALTHDEDLVFQAAYAKWLAFAESLLEGGDTKEGIDQAGHAATTAAKEHLGRLGIDLTDDEDDGQPSPGGIKDRILDLLADGQPWALRDVRHHLSDVAPGSVNNAMNDLRQTGHVQPAGPRGTYQITQ